MSTKKDAVKQVEKLIKAAKLCIISDIQYEEVVKQVSKGRPSKNKPAETIFHAMNGKNKNCDIYD
jgi:hypothetical protein